ncbi:hypothetical protein Tco_0549187 [Tanacetum coccineum]
MTRSLANGKIGFALELVHFVPSSKILKRDHERDHLGWTDVEMPYFYQTQGRKKSKTSKTTSGSTSGGIKLNEEADEAVQKDKEQQAYLDFKNQELSIRETEAREIAQLKMEKLEIQRRTLELAEREKWDRDILFYNSVIDPTLPPIQQTEAARDEDGNQGAI